MRELLFGIETEYGFSVLESEGGAASPGPASARLLQHATARRAHLPSGGRLDVFLANGARLYVDAGCHPEYATPECTDPLTVVACVRAGDRLMWTAAEEMAETMDVEVFLSRSNVDHLAGVTWGCHESYLCRSAPPSLAAHLLSHLVSRIVYTGGGGLERTGKGVRFVLSQRVTFIRHAFFTHSADSDRGIFHLRHEPLAGPGFHRLHVVCGDSLWSETADYLRIATTALVVALIDSDRLGAVPVLADPVAAIHRFSRDPSCTATVAVADGSDLTAIQIQRILLRRVEERLSDGTLPAWAPAVCARWSRTLDELEAGAATLRGVLDWPLKRALFQAHIERRGRSWDDLDRTPLMGAVPTGLRDQLFELDMRFGQLGPKGIFLSLDRAAVLDHRILPEGAVDRYVDTPPGGGRAERRGRLIEEHARKRGVYEGGWTFIRDRTRGRCLEMADPFSTRRPGWVADL